MTVPGGRLVATVKLSTDRDVARARQAVSRAFDDLKARAIRKTRFVTAVSEIARNAVTHGRGGEMSIFVHDRPPGVSVICSDNGPGIENTEQAMSDGFSTGRSMGKGLGGARRLADTFELVSSPGSGTVVRMSGTA
ncbi:ATP-binding protein [Oricola cellulosilytica]|uniref:ATP-binding protein n=1 Tax=Oricola cellulosilytica TaxID=1429082 RepID=A0A4R0PEW0_9HYPH|nr:ATP-binding protein [Oricola cellulosilytica]TCD16141.1 ATP-binding protein [Oricola cellulosilytica]